MKENKDGTFGPIQSLDEMIKEIYGNPDNIENVKAIHFGTESELKQKREEIENQNQIEDKLDDLTNRLDEIEMKNKTPLHIPTGAEIDAIMEKSGNRN